MEKKELIELINMVLDIREEQKEEIYNPMGKLESDQLDKFAKAFSGMQGDYESVIANRTNPHYKSRYADLDAALKSVRPLFKKYELSMFQSEEVHNEEKYLRTKLLHSSGQFISSFSQLTQDRPGLQGYGAGLSYHKRYSACCLLGLTTDNDPDDNDAELKSNQNKPQRQVNNKAKAQSKEATILLSRGEIEYINMNLKSHDDVRNELLATLQKKSIEECPKSLFDTIVQFIDAKIDKKKNNRLH